MVTPQVVRVASDGKPVAFFDTQGHAVDAHDGAVVQFGGRYYLYGTAYDRGFEWGRPRLGSWGGFRIYSSVDLTTWVDHGLAFEPTDDWQQTCASGCYRPHVIFNAQTGMYVMWVNTLWGPSGYTVLTSPTPTGPWTLCPPPSLAHQFDGWAGNQDMNLFVDHDGAAYVMYTNGDEDYTIWIERLDAGYLNGTGEFAKLPKGRIESPAMFKDGSTYFVAVSDPNCGYCPINGIGLFYAPTPLGPFMPSPRPFANPSCYGQTTAIERLTGPDGESMLLFQADRWNGRRNEALASFEWAPVSWPGDGFPTVDCQDTFLIGALGPSEALPSGAAIEPEADWSPDGFVNNTVSRGFTFTVPSTGRLSRLGFNLFRQTLNHAYDDDPRAGDLNADATVDLHRWIGTSLGEHLASGILSIDSTSFRPRMVTFSPNTYVEDDEEFAAIIRSATSLGTFGLVRSSTDSPVSTTLADYGDDVVMETGSIRFQAFIGAQTGQTLRVHRVPSRLADTRDLDAPLEAGESRAFDLRGKVPAGASGVLLNVTAVEPDGDGFLVLYGDDDARPASSTVNIQAGGVRSALSTALHGPSRRVRVYASKRMHVVLDLVGYTTPSVTETGGNVVILDAANRVYDSRLNDGLRSHDSVITVSVDPPTGAVAVIVNLTSTESVGSGYVSASARGARSRASSLTYQTGETISNRAVVPLGADNAIRLRVGLGPTHLVVDVMGFVMDSSKHLGWDIVAPVRVYDSRDQDAIPDPHRLWLAGVRGVPADVHSVAVNITVDPAAAGWTAAYSSGGEWSGTSDVNYAGGYPAANLALLPLGPDGSISFTQFLPEHLIVDLLGYFR
jgi:Glycosyl hydrolases family 43